MRILHTSDWHVGKTIRGRSRVDEHRAVLAEIVAIAAEREVDIVVVPGDLFDTSAPSPESEQLVYRTLLDLAATGAHVVTVAGNHDNARRLEAVAPLLLLTSVASVSTLRRPEDGGVIDVTTRGGEVARIALLPFLSQRGIVRADDLMSLHADEHQGQYAGRVRQIVGALTAGFGDDTVNIIAAHLTVVGGKLGGGERDAHTIFDYHVPTSVFPSSAHYVALGHLHKPQRLDAAAPVWYCGSPLQLDFGEAAGPKAVLIVDATPGVPAKIEQVELTSGRRLRTITGTLDELEALRDEVGDDYLRVVIAQPPRAGLADEVRLMFPEAVDVRVADPEATDRREDWEMARFQRSPVELFSEYLTERGVEDEAMLALFADLHDEVTADPLEQEAALAPDPA